VYINEGDETEILVVYAKSIIESKVKAIYGYYIMTGLIITEEDVDWDGREECGLIRECL